MPFQLLVHNDLGADHEITVRWSQDEEGKKRRQEKTVFVPKGKAEPALLWYGPPDDEDIVFEWQGEAGERKLRVPAKEFGSRPYHAYVGKDGVRLAGQDAMDKIHEALTGYNAPITWGFVVLFGLPTAVHLLLRRRASRLPQPR